MGRGQDGWFAPQHHCKVETPPTFKAGCPYMYSVSTACMRDENVRGGCARYHAEGIRSGLLPIANIALFLMVFQVRWCVAWLAAAALFGVVEAHDTPLPMHACDDSATLPPHCCRCWCVSAPSACA